MPPRPGIAELTRLLTAVADPLYVVDQRRRIVYVNEACGRWLACKPDELLGRECRYAPAESSDALDALARSLCPPPAAFAGEQVVAEIVPPREDKLTVCAPRRALFTPWRLAAPESFAVAVWVPEPEWMERDAAQRRRAPIPDRDRAGRHQIERPPSTGSASPVMKAASSEAR